jgi:hypothetical protein
MSVVSTAEARSRPRKAKTPAKSEQVVHLPAPRVRHFSPHRALSLPLAFTLGLAAFGLLERTRETPRLVWAFCGAAAVLLAWNAMLFLSMQRRGRTLTLTIEPRKQHYLQACAQLSVLAYWGWYWPQVYASAYLIAAQLAFAYAFDMLLSWSRRDEYTLGFAPFPVIFSINLFLWFKPDWFFLQFLMVAVGFAAKELIRWDKDGRRTHIFNPSSFPLAVVSLALLLTGTTDITWGVEIANTQFYPPHIYLVLFLVGLPGQFFFGVTSMTMSAAVTLYLFGLAYFGATGIYFFFDSYIPIAVFLGMHLLFTDPSTSPRTELGRILFGVLYALTTILLYQLLGTMGAPSFYDKLLQVPILNLSIKLIDRAVRADVLKRFDPAALGRWLAPRQRNLAYMSIWAIAFVGMSAFQGVGDAHRGQFVPFWQQACSEERPYACEYLANIEQTFCVRESGWACNEFGLLLAQRQRDLAGATESFQRGCRFGFSTSCANANALASGERTVERASPTLTDYPIILRGTKGEIRDPTPEMLYARACKQGWPGACEPALGTALQ